MLRQQSVRRLILKENAPTLLAFSRTKRQRWKRTTERPTRARDLHIQRRRHEIALDNILIAVDGNLDVKRCHPRNHAQLDLYVLHGRLGEPTAGQQRLAIFIRQLHERVERLALLRHAVHVVRAKVRKLQQARDAVVVSLARGDWNALREALVELRDTDLRTGVRVPGAVDRRLPA